MYDDITKLKFNSILDYFNYEIIKNKEGKISSFKDKYSSKYFYNVTDILKNIYNVILPYRCAKRRISFQKKLEFKNNNPKISITLTKNDTIRTFKYNSKEENQIKMVQIVFECLKIYLSFLSGLPEDEIEELLLYGRTVISNTLLNYKLKSFCRTERIDLTTFNLDNEELCFLRKKL